MIEINHSFRQDWPLVLKPKEFKKVIQDSNHKYITLVEIKNLKKRMEVMIPSFNVNPQLIGISTNEIIKINTKITPLHPDAEEQKNDYWSAYILKANKSTFVEIEIEYEITNTAIDKIKCLWLDIEWSNYGPFGTFKRFDGFVLPNFIDISEINSSNTNSIDPIKTHILGSLDDPIGILKSYMPENCLPTDILTIGESPLAIMQGRYIDYRNVNSNLISRLICKGFHPTSSLATASGMQTLINISGPTRVIISWLIGGIFKFFGIRGIFYRLAGEQARLIDDITGTTPPYDKSIVLGPKNTQTFCIKAAKTLNINVAVVDVNDLGRVKILSTNNDNNTEIIKRALTSNPAGNANQQTPLVLIRSNELS
ncbi:hypothetical protein [Prochlorococcus marinus]|uniref:hypothetical protein n=1 Tax=Prochlorococcus marinus TaxID=1219 RepID=UPI0022B3D65C|nr:hypothetical protein [Prochlorococcus marinus]